MNSRRTIIAALGGMLAAPAFVLAQRPKKVARIGYVGTGTPTSSARNLQAFRDRLHELGRVEGENIVIDYRFSHGKTEIFPALTAELMRLNPDCLVAVGASAIRAAMQQTKTTPIVFPNVDLDPVREGYVASLARPGGNVTGLTGIAWELAGKRLELLLEVAPKARRIGLLFDSGGAGHHIEATQAAARKLGLDLQLLGVGTPQGIGQAFKAMREAGAGAVSVIHTGFMRAVQSQVVNLAMDARLPAIYSHTEFVGEGGLMAYAPDIADQHRRTAEFVHKILNGTRPADLPVEQPTKFELAINMKTAKALGITFPQTILVRAERVIE